MEKSQLLKNSLRRKSKPSTFFCRKYLLLQGHSAPPVSDSLGGAAQREGGGGRCRNLIFPLSYFDQASTDRNIDKALNN